MLATGGGRRALGLACSLLNMALSSSGFVLQRKAHLMSERDFHSYRPLWLLGVVLYIASALPDLVAYAYLPQVLCATIACFRVVAVCMLGHIFLDERLGRGDVHNIAICTLGTILCVLFGPDSDESTATSSNAMKHPMVAIYSAFGLSALAIFLLIAHGDSLGWISTNSKLYKLSLPLATALAFGVEKVYNTELGFMKMPKHILAEPLWLMMAGIVALLGCVDFYLNARAAKRMPLYIFVPLSFAFSTSLQCFQAMVVFDEFRDMTVFDCVVTWLGVILSLNGALRIQPPQAGQARDAPVIVSQVQLVDRVRTPRVEKAEDKSNAPPLSASSLATPLHPGNAPAPPAPPPAEHSPGDLEKNDEPAHALGSEAEAVPASEGEQLPG